MAFCVKCGTELPTEASICPKCGARADDPAKAAPTVNASADFTAQFDPADIETNKMMAIFCYLGTLMIIPMLVSPAKDSAFVRFHFNQGLILLIGYLVSALLSFLCGTAVSSLIMLAMLL